MATKVHMEALSPTMEEGQVVKWLKAEGDTVANGDVLAEVETDKATMELVARGDGVLRAIFLAEGGTAPVGEVIGVIAEADEDISGFAPAPAEAESPVKPQSPVKPESPATPPAEPVVVPQAPAVAQQAATLPAPPSGNGRIKASPVARRLARDAGVELTGIVGSGPGGRIVKKDVEGAIASGVSAPAAPASVPAGMPAPGPAPVLALDGPDYEDIPLSQIRKTIARRLTESLGPIPTFFLNIHVDMSRLLETRKRINALLESRAEKVSINDMVVKATAVALTQNLAVNAHWGGDHIRRFNRVHVAVAVAIPDGLITPVVRDANLKGVAQIGREIRDMAARAREKKLMPDEYTGSTFSVSNLGMFGVHEFTALINPPEAGILAIGGIEQVPVVIEGKLKSEPRMTITMSCDHRTIDGATGARFLQTLKVMLEDPAVMMV